MRSVLGTAIAILPGIVGLRSASAVDYFWTNANGGAYDEPSNWTPFSPPGTQGPGGAGDTINFDLGVSSITPYFVTDMGRENSQLIVHNDSLLLSVFVHHELTSSGGADASFIVGAASGDDGFVSLFGGGVSVLDTQVVRLANAAGSEGSVRINALQWNSDNFRVGYAGDGIMSMDADATLNSTNASIAHLPGSTGRATVQGDWNVDGALNVGRQGEASLEISAGGTVTSGSGIIGDLAMGIGEASVSATWSSTSLTVGDRGAGALTIRGPFGHVSSANAFVARQTGSSGTATVESGLWAIGEKLSVGGDVETLTDGGNGILAITGGTVTVAQEITVFNNGELALEAGSLDAPIITNRSGWIDWTGGTLTVDTFNGSLSNNGGVLRARAGSNSILVSEEFSQSPDGMLSLAIDGSAANQYDSMIVGNTAFLDGVLNVTLAEGFESSAADVFTLLDAQFISGDGFTNAANGERMFLDFSSGSFLVHYGAQSAFDPSQLVLTDFQRPATGDFDDDGDADGKDFLIWQRGESPDPLSDEDFAAWKQHFGAAPATANIATVPEPTSAGLLMAAGALGELGRVKRRRRGDDARVGGATCPLAQRRRRG